MAEKEEEQLKSQEFGTNKVEDDDSILSDLDFIRFLVVAKKNLHWIGLILLLGTLISFLYLRYTKPIYQAKSIIKYDLKQVSPMVTSELAQADNYGHLSGEIELIKSNIIYDEVIKVLPLGVSYYAYGRINNTERYQSSPFLVKYFKLKNTRFYDVPFDVDIEDNNTFLLSYYSGGNLISKKYAFGDIIENNELKFVIGKSDTTLDLEVGKKFYFTINSKEKLSQFIASKLEVKVANYDAKTIEIAFSDYDRFKAKDIVNVIDSIYLSQTILKKNKAHEQSIAFLNEQLGMTEQNLEEYEQKIEAFTRQNKTPDIKSEITRYLSKAESEALLLEKLKVQLDILSKLQDAVYKNTGIEKVMPLLYLLEDENKQLQKQAEKLFEMETKEHQLLGTSKEKTFAIQSIRGEVSKTRDILIDHITEYRKLLTEEIEKSQGKVKEYESAFSILPSKETEFTKLKRFYNLYEKFYLMLIDKKAEYGISKAGTVPEFQILTYPSVPSVPIYPNNFQVYFIGLISAFIVGFFLIVVKYFLDNTINNIGELERISLAPAIGFIPTFNSHKMDYSQLIVSQFPKSPVSEALRTIRTNLEFLSKGKSNKVIAITSTISGEGKTFVAINLGGIIALTGQRVVILDFDLRKPKIGKAFNADNSHGISTLLIGRSEYEKVINTTSIPTYFYIPSGPVPPNPSELIMSKEFDHLLERLKKDFDVIIIDTPPIGIVTDGILVMKKCDLNLYIVRAEYSRKGFERNINNLITKNKFKNIAVVLNSFDNLRSYAYGYKYGYGQGYGYGEYYQEEEEKQSLLSKLKKIVS